MDLQTLRVKIFADGAEKATMSEMYQNPMIAGFTTNPTLMRKAGVSDYVAFAKEVLLVIKDKPISFEVFSDDFAEMKRQAKEIASWGSNVFVKIPITNTKGESSVKLVRELSSSGVKVNVTALMMVEQVKSVVPAIDSGTPAYVSIFAGRIADSGRDPMPIMKEALSIISKHREIELIWASPRELLNIVQASSIGCHVITVTNDLLKKLPLLGKDLGQFSLETVMMFYDDAKAAGFNFKGGQGLPRRGPK